MHIFVSRNRSYADAGDIITVDGERFEVVFRFFRIHLARKVMGNLK